MTDRELQSARQWASRILFGDEPPADGQLVPSVMRMLRETELSLDEDFIDAATVLLCEADTLPPHAEVAVEEFHREQLRQDVRQFAMTCWNDPEDLRRANWEQLHARANGDPVFTALLGELQPLLHDFHTADGLSDEELTLLQKARLAAALPGRMGAGPKTLLMMEPEFSRGSIEQLATRQPSTGRWIQRVLVPRSLAVEDTERRKWPLVDWLENLYRLSAVVVVGFLALAFITNAFQRSPQKPAWVEPAPRRPAWREDDLNRGIQRYLSMPESVRKKLLRGAVNTMRGPQNRLGPPAPADDRPPAPPVAVPLTETSGTQ